jgi:ABC-2 type transport system ATP-binding protein
MNENPAIAAHDLRYAYEGGQEALKGVSFRAERGRITGLLGPNGSGKSTAFKILSTQLRAQAGEGFVDGFSTSTQRAQARERLGVTFQSPSLDPWLSILENLRIHAALLGLSKTEASTRITESLEFLRLTERAGERVRTLSGGLARRAELAKTLLGRPTVLLLDEPTTGLDPLARKEFWERLRVLASQGCGILVTTHLMEEAEHCDELLFIAEGSIVARGTPTELKAGMRRERLVLQGPELREELKGIRELLGARLETFEWETASLADVYFEKTGKSLT